MEYEIIGQKNDENLLQDSSHGQDDKPPVKKSKSDIKVCTLIKNGIITITEQLGTNR